MIVLNDTHVQTFIQRNFRQASRQVKETLYFIFIRPCSEHASVVWDLHQIYLIEKLEKKQKQCARFTLNKTE